jgi:hypothetical protein
MLTRMRGGALSLVDGHDHLPSGTLEVSPARELVALPSVNAAYEADGSVAEDTLQRPMLAFGYGPIPARMPEAEVVEICEREVIWGGRLGLHFGHFLTESVTRMWPLISAGALEGAPVVFAPAGNPPVAGEWLAGFGAETILLPPDGAVRFERMRVPEQAWRLGAWIAPEMRDIHLQARRGLAVPSLPRHDVLWLSRSGMPAERSPYDEGLLEWALGDRVTPVQPETMSLAEQVGMLESCRAVAGVMGSAFHALLLTEDTPDSLYLCPAFAKSPYSAQHWLLEAEVGFREVVLPAARLRRLRREGFYFPGGHRVLVPEALRALSETVLPGLLEDERLAAFADPERGRRHSGLSEIDAAAIEVVREPFSAGARTGLARLFEEQGQERWAEEQLGFARELGGDS